MTTPFDPDIILRANVLTPRVEKKLLRKRKRRKGVKGKESRKSPRNIRKESTDEEKHDKEVEDSEETGKKKCRVRKLHARNSYEERRNDMGKDDDLADLEEFIERDSTDEEVLEPKRGRKKRVFKHMEETYPGKQTDIVKGVVSTNSYTTTWEAEWEEEEVVRILVTVNHSSEEESDIDQLEEEWCQQNLDSLLSSASPPWDIRVEQNWLGETPESDRGTPAFEQEQDGREASVEPREKAAVCWLDERGSDMSDGILIELFEECSSEETEMSEKIMAHASFEENNKDQEISTAELGPETPITSNRETAGWQQEVGTSLALCNKSNSKMESLKHGCAGLRVMNQHSSPALDDPEPGKTKDKIRSGEIRERVKMSFKHSSMPEKFAKNDSFKRTNKSMKKVCSNGTFHRLSMSKKSKENNHTLFGSPRGSFRRPKTEKNSVTRGERGPIMIAEGSKGMNRSIKTGGATNRMSMRNERNKEMLLDIKSRAESWSKYACERMAERTEAAQESEEVRMNKEENQDELRARRTTRMRKVSRDREKNKEELEAEKVKRRQEWK
ncbi:hypothetical protein RRG08_047863 [Elysia crispata]|uniref:Uncharacterized protein n=2 Tax=Elysia crispata TaxID=231223 RepID=A0AAE0ZXA2_9GAST|nr:hypothetical protein RRG08_047863 [Elysia crispata]